MLGKIVAVLALISNASAVQLEAQGLAEVDAEVNEDYFQLAETEAELAVEEATDADANADFSAEAASAAVAAAELGYNIAKDIGAMIWEVTGSYKPYRHMWSFDLNGHGVAERWLQDHDLIRIERHRNTCNSCGNRRVKICLRTPNWMTWWKAVTIHANNRFMYELAYGQDRNRGTCGIIEYSALLQNYIVLSKAKQWGIHTNMYWVQNSYMFRPGHDWYIKWNRD